MSISTFLESAILQKVFRGVEFESPRLFVSLHTDDPGRTGGSELRGGSYARQPVEFDQALTNSGALEFRDLQRSTVTHAGLWDAARGGHFLWGVNLRERHSIGEGWNFQMRRGLISGPSIQ